jgi:hypothetical protein
LRDKSASRGDDHQPATAPEQKPSTLGLPRTIHSIIGQTKEATAVASVVVVKALAAMTSAPTALPALNPYQPTHSMPVPIMHSTMLCGEFFFAEAHALAEDQAENERRPAGGHVHHRAAGEVNGLDFGVAFHTPFIKPSMPQIMWACGK